MARDLNPAQQQAVRTLRGPLLVLAGAGSGKTRVVTYRIAALIRHGTAADRILAVTFTNKAAREMKERAAALLGKRLRPGPEISTFHSLCVRVLRRHITRLGYPAQFAIYSRGDQLGIARAALREIRAPTTALRPADLVAEIGRWKTRGMRPAEAIQHANSDKQHLAAAAYRRYQRALEAAGAVDFDDLLLLSEDLFARHADVRRAEASRFDHVLIDEYQDTNQPQYRIIRALVAEHRNLCVVGDDDQSIYAWRGAQVQHILQFQRDWPDATVVRLEENYRSRAPILALANQLITFNSARFDKQLRPARSGGERPRILQFADEETEARELVREIADLIRRGECRAREVAMLFRTKEQPRPFETELRKAQLPYVLVGSRSFFDRVEVRDVLAYLTLLVLPRDDVALRRILNAPPRGVSAATIATLAREAATGGVALWDVLVSAAEAGRLTSRGVQSVRELAAALERNRARLAQHPPSEVARKLVAEIGYRDEITRRYPEAGEQEQRWRLVEGVVNSLAAYEQESRQGSLRAALDDLLLADRDDEPDVEDQLDRDAIALLTLHGAKGLEFPHVYLVGMEEGLLPHRRSIELDDVDEERRLCYVGVTRAQERLTLSLALSRRKWGQSRRSVPSRFLFEMTGQSDRPQARAALKEATESLGPKRSAGSPSRSGSSPSRRRAGQAAPRGGSAAPPGKPGRK